MAEKDSTTIVETNDDISTLLQQPGAESIITPTDDKNKEGKNSIFSRKPVDLSFLDNPNPNPPGKSKEELEAEAELKKQEGIKNGTLNPDGTPKAAPVLITNEELNNLELESEGSKPGPKKLDKNGLYELTKKLIDKKLIIPFEDEKPLEEYTMTDFEELYEANDQAKKEKLAAEVPEQFFKSLPDKLKYAAKYVADGGTDLTSLFSALAQAEHAQELDPEVPEDAETIVRQYLQSTNRDWTAEEIQEEIDGWRDRDELEAKANKFKPKLANMKEEFVKYKVQEQEVLKKRQQAQAETYMKNVYDVLEPADLNGVKLDKKTQAMLYSGLTQPSYQSVSGKQTNMLGHLLEKYQFVEPRHDLIAEALWLLADPDGYKAKLRESGKKDAINETVRKLKTEEKNRIASTVNDEEPEDHNKPKGLKRPSGGTFFKR